MDGITLELSEESQARLASSRTARARAEWAEWQALVDAARELHGHIDAEPEPLRRLVMRSGVGLTLGRRLGLSEGQVASRVMAAERVIASTPSVWEAFEAGRLDGVRVREVSWAVDKLQEPACWARLKIKVLSIHCWTGPRKILIYEFE